MGVSNSRRIIIGAVTAAAFLKVPAFAEKNPAVQQKPSTQAEQESAKEPAAQEDTSAKAKQQTKSAAISTAKVEVASKPATPKQKSGVPAQNVSVEIAPPKKPTLFSHTSYPEAWTASQQSNRPILLYVSMSGCHHCDKMMAESYRTPEMEQMLVDSFETIYVTRKQHPKLVEKLRVKWYPTTVLVGQNNKIMDVIEGYVDVKTFRSRLKTSLASTKPSLQAR